MAAAIAFAHYIILPITKATLYKCAVVVRYVYCYFERRCYKKARACAYLDITTRKIIKTKVQRQQFMEFEVQYGLKTAVAIALAFLTATDSHV